MVTLIIVLIAVLASAITTQLVLRPKLKSVQSIDRSVIKENEENQRLKAKLEIEVARLDTSKIQKQRDIEDASRNLSQLNTILENRKQSIEDELKRSAKAAEITIGENLEKTAEIEREKLNKALAEIQEEYDSYMVECALSLNEAIEEKKTTITDFNAALQELQSKYFSIIEENKRAEEIKVKADFYRLQISDADLKEVQKLREIGKELRDPTPLNKMIWTQYFRNLWSELSGRVIGSGRRTGIYKITNLSNGMAQIGQAQDLRDRWSTHIKTGLGAETPTRNKLYPAMLTFGVENFTFEVLEECSSEQLNEREKFQIEFQDTTNYGQNVTRGGS